MNLPRGEGGGHERVEERGEGKGGGKENGQEGKKRKKDLHYLKNVKY